MDPVSTYYLTQGVLGSTVVVLAGVIIYVQKKLDRKESEYTAEIKALNALLVATIQTHAKDFQEMSKDSQEVMSNTAQTVALLGANIEVVKERHRQ